MAQPRVFFPCLDRVRIRACYRGQLLNIAAPAGHQACFRLGSEHLRYPSDERIAGILAAAAPDALLGGAIR